MNWEYISRYIYDCDTLNDLGGKGWELCGIEDHWFYFKRPMSCTNCKHCVTKKEVVSSGISYTQSFCTKNSDKKHLCNLEGCEYFKSKEND